MRSGRASPKCSAVASRPRSRASCRASRSSRRRAACSAARRSRRRFKPLPFPASPFSRGVCICTQQSVRVRALAHPIPRIQPQLTYRKTVQTWISIRIRCRMWTGPAPTFTCPPTPPGVAPHALRHQHEGPRNIADQILEGVLPGSRRAQSGRSRMFHVEQGGEGVWIGAVSAETYCLLSYSGG